MSVATFIVPTEEWEKDKPLVDWLVAGKEHQGRGLGTALLNCTMILGHIVQGQCRHPSVVTLAQARTDKGKRPICTYYT